MRTISTALTIALLIVTKTTFLHAQAAATTLFRNVNVFDGTKTLGTRDVLIRDGRIARIATRVDAPAGATIIDGTGKTLLPGLIDAHTHTWADAGKAALPFGVTTEIDMFTDVAIARTARAEQAAGKADGRADLYSAGTLVTAPKGHGAEYGIAIPTITKPEDAQAFVDARIAEGSDFIKIVYDDGHSYGMKLPTLSRETMRAVIDAAHRRQKLAVVHIGDLHSAREAIAAGADGLVHLFADSAPTADLIALAKQHKTFVIPTLTVIMSITGKPGAASLLADTRLTRHIARQDSLIMLIVLSNAFYALSLSTTTLAVLMQLMPGALAPVLEFEISRVVLVMIAAGLVSAIFAAFVDINEFSLHAMYRNRLVRAFLRASRGKDYPRSDKKFYGEDDVNLAELWPGQTQRRSDSHLFHVINATLNDVGGQRPEWNERKGVSFTFSPLHVGAHIPGRYREPGESQRGGYRSLLETQQSPRLGTAMSISGAAASPNMGYHSSSVVTFLMALFNVRLGGWMHRPWEEGDWTIDLRRKPTRTWKAWWGEVFGGTSFNSSIVNVTDGGHFDNLGLYEIIRRRARFVVVVDAGQDSNYTFESLAEAIRKVRVDFGVPISMTNLDLSLDAMSRGSNAGRSHVYCGTIHYSRVDARSDGKPAPDGTIVYIKPAVTGDESVDVQAYQRRCPTFPHEPTADQWFSESQFESYRALGEHSVEHALNYYKSSKGQVEPMAKSNVPLRPQAMSPFMFCSRIVESLAMMRRQRESSTHAGGVVYRKQPDGTTEFLLIRSTDNQYRILPKGYIEPWEDAVSAAVREVREECGITAIPIRNLGSSTFTAPAGKITTTYFLMVKGDDEATTPIEEYRLPDWYSVERARSGKRTDLEVPQDVVKVLEKAVAALETRAGGVVYRHRQDGDVEFLFVRSSDGTARVLPKGHMDAGENAASCAVREVIEESGYKVAITGFLGSFPYQKGSETVNTMYYLMRPDGNPVRPESNRDPVWLTMGAAKEKASGVPEDLQPVLDSAIDSIKAE